MRLYKALKKQVFNLGDFSIVPIRYEDRLDIMKWRNEQIYHLRQVKKLTKKNQNDYFDNIVSMLFKIVDLSMNSYNEFFFRSCV